MEFRRILSKRNIIIICMAFLTNLVLFMYGTSNGGKIQDTIERARRYESAIAQVEKMSVDEAIAYIKDNKLASKDSVYKDVRARLNYIRGYNQKIMDIITRADVLKNNPLFSDPESYAYNNIIKTKADFTKLLNVTPVLENDWAVEAVADYVFNIPIAGLAVFLILMNLYKERDNGMWELVHTTRRGRLILAVKRIGIIALLVGAITALLYVSTVIIAFVLYGGVGQLGGPIQNIEAFSQCTVLISKAEYLLISFILYYITIIFLASVLYLLFTIFRNKKNVAIGLTVFALVEYFFYIKIESQSIYGVLHNINILNLVDINNICMQYQNIGSGTIVIQVGTLLITVMLAVIVLCLAASVAIYSAMYPNIKQNIIAKALSKVNELYQFVISRAPHLIKEMHKTVFTGKGVWLIIGVLFAAGYFSNTGFITFSDSESADDRVYLEQGGAEYDAIITRVDNATREYEIAKKEQEKALAAYEKGEITTQQLFAAGVKMDYYSSIYFGVSEFKYKIAYLNRLKQERGIDGYMMSDRGYYQTFGSDSLHREWLITGILWLAVFLIANAIVRLEKKSGMNVLIRCSRNGSFKNHIHKIIALGITVFLLAVIVYVMDYINVLGYYGAPYLEAPVQSLTFMQNIGLNVSVLQWLILLVLGKSLVAAIISVGVYIFVANFTRIIRTFPTKFS